MTLARAAPQRDETNKREEVDRGPWDETPGRVEEKTRAAGPRRVHEHRLEVLEQVVARAGHEEPEHAPVRVAEHKHERGERDRARDSATDLPGARAQRRVPDDQAEPDSDEPSARREPRQCSGEEAREDELAGTGEHAATQEAPHGHEPKRGAR